MKIFVPCKTKEEAESFISKDCDFVIDSADNPEEFSNYHMAVEFGFVKPDIHPYIVWKDADR